MRAPREVGTGLAKVSISCADWPKAAVAPLALELPVTPPKVKPVLNLEPALKHSGEQQGVKSIDSRSETSIKFVNRSKQTVKVLWLDYAGNRQHKETLEPGESYGPTRTFVTHPWLITGKDDRAWSIFQPDAQLRTVEILEPLSQSRAK